MKIFFTLALIFLAACSKHPGKSKDRVLTQQLSLAVQMYEEEYGERIVDLSNKNVLLLVTGENEKKIKFYSIGLEKLDDEGNILDLWGTQIKFKRNEQGRLVAVSAGKDRKFGTDDDI
ncbi:MAG: hypothetical protein AAFX93_00465 [Verrucomicrobiota bacterium]